MGALLSQAQGCHPLSQAQGCHLRSQARWQQQQELWRQQEPASGAMAGQRGQAALVPWLGMRLLLAPELLLLLPPLLLLLPPGLTSQMATLGLTQRMTTLGLTQQAQGAHPMQRSFS